jgi:hypothetical protein
MEYYNSGYIYITIKGFAEECNTEEYTVQANVWNL